MTEDELFRQLIEICGYLPKFVDDGAWSPATKLQDLVMRTLARGRGTYEAIVELVCNDRSLQAAMLGRSLFEDMAVAHWLVLHRDDPDWLVQQFFDHRDAMRLHSATGSMPGNWDRSHIDISDLSGREDELRHRFGAYAERDWWGQDRSGKRITMPSLVKALADAEQFQPRLKGDEPVLEQYYSFLQKTWTQALHHTAVGMQLRIGESGEFPRAVSESNPFIILYGNYWVFGQLIFVTLELAAPVAAIVRFQDLFLLGLAIFGESIGVHAPWADEIMNRHEATPDV